MLRVKDIEIEKGMNVERSKEEGELIVEENEIREIELNKDGDLIDVKKDISEVLEKERNGRELMKKEVDMERGKGREEKRRKKKEKKRIEESKEKEELKRIREEG